MFTINQLLAILERDGVDLLVLQEGSAPHARDNGNLRPLSKQSTDRRALELIVNEAGASDAISEALQSGNNQSIPFSVGTQHYVADILFRKGRLQVRFSESNAPVSAEPPKKTQARPSPPPRPSPPTHMEKAAGTLEAILSESRKQGASDVHISADYPPLIRIMGRLKDAGPAISADVVEEMLSSLLNGSELTALDTVGYTDLALDFKNAGRMRINISRQRKGLKGCFRLIAPEPAPLESLGLPAALSKITLHHQGLVVVSGPNGAGKTTTLASLVDLFNASRPIHIVTVEDPVEIIHRPKKAVISQRQVGTHTRSFQTALKGALREDPDVIAIGELRDLETVEMALSAAETGHLVIATMSTPSGAVTIDRLIDMFPQGVQSQVRNTLAGALKMIVSQKLIPGRDGTSRHVAAEIIVGNIPLYAMIRDNKLYQLPSLLQQGKAYGMIRLEDSLNALVEKGVVDMDTAKNYANDKNAVGRGLVTPSEPSPPPDDKRSRFGNMANKFRGK